MLRVIFCLVLLILFSLEAKAKEVEPAISTEGVEIEQNIINTIKPSKELKNERKQKRKETKLYFKNKKIIKKQDYKKVKYQKNIEYLEKRLEMKKNRIEAFNPNQKEGETEE